MTNILKERHLIVSEIKTFQYEGELNDSIVDSLLSSIHKSMGYTNEDFQNSWEYYLNQSSEELLQIFDSVLINLEYESELTN